MEEQKENKGNIKKKRDKTHNSDKKSNVNCCVPNCNSTYRNNVNVSFHKFPTEKPLLKKWILNIRTDKPISPRMLVCSRHFSNDMYFPETKDTIGKTQKSGSKGRLRRRLKLSLAYPTLNLPKKSHETSLSAAQQARQEERSIRVKRRSQETCAAARQVITGGCSHNLVEPQCQTEHDKSIVADTDGAINEDQEEVLPFPWTAEAASELQNAASALLELSSFKALLDKSTQCSMNVVPTTSKTSYKFINELIRSEDDLQTISGISGFKILQTLETGVNCIENECKINFAFPAKERILLTLMRIKCDVSFKFISIIFQCTASTCQNYFHNMVPKLARILNSAITWPTKEQVMSSMPTCFDKYRNTMAVLDCTEIRVEVSNCLECKILTYSFYKGGHTIKLLVCVSPSGLITYLSCVYGGRASDKAIFEDSNLLSKLEPHVDALMVDKGFLIEKECMLAGIVLHRPPFLKDKARFSEAEAAKGKSIGRARVHVERTIGRLKEFKLLANRVPSHLVPVMNNIVVICGALVNLSSPILAKDKFYINK